MNDISLPQDTVKLLLDLDKIYCQAIQTLSNSMQELGIFEGDTFAGVLSDLK